MMHFHNRMIQALIAWSALLLTSCGGSGGAGAQAPMLGAFPQAPAPSASEQLFVPNDIGGGLGSVTAYAANAAGNVAPAAVITGSATKLGPATSVAFDTAGNLYVANKGVGCVSACIAEFAAGASGNVVPLRTICGAHTELGGQLGGIAIDGSGNIYVANPPESVLIFSANAQGDIAPVRSISGSNTGLAVPTGIAVDAAGRIYVANRAGGSGSGSVTIFAAGASGNVAPDAIIAGTSTTLSNPTGLALDGAGNIYVTNVVSASVTVFAAGAGGNVAPVRTIEGTNTQLNGTAGIALDASGTAYVTTTVTTSINGGISAAGAVAAFAPGASGNVAPVRIITGAATRLGGVGMPAVR